MSLPPRLPGESLIDYRKRVERDPRRWGMARKTEARAPQRKAQDTLREMFTAQGRLEEPQQLPPVPRRGASVPRPAGPWPVVRAVIRYAIVITLLLLLAGLLLWQLGSR